MSVVLVAEIKDHIAHSSCLRVLPLQRRHRRCFSCEYDRLTFSDEFVPDLVSAMFVEAITWWLEHGRPYTPREIATRSALLAAALFKEASIWQ